MKTLSIEEIKSKELDILLFIKQLCEENGITFYLAFGTLLGAVRHSGFIPWDDDIDIHMTRQDYLKFCKVIKKYSGKYKLLSLETDESYSWILPKVVDTETFVSYSNVRKQPEFGVWVDIFVLDNIPDNSIVRRRFLRKVQFYKLLWDFSVTKIWIKGCKFYKNLFRLIFCFSILLNPRNIALRLNSYAQKYNNSESQQCFYASYAHKNPRILDARLFEECQVVQFEGTEYKAPAYDEYLTYFYKNYMQLPPIEAQKSNHDMVVYSK